MAFLVIREGLESGVRLGARSTQRLTYQLRLALEPDCFEDPTASPREVPRMEWTMSDSRGVRQIIAEFSRRNFKLAVSRAHQGDNRF